MPRTHIRPVRLRRWFPPGDPIAAAVARLCILREDLTLELFGIVADDLGKLDGNVVGYRQMYFWRNTLRTLSEIRDSLNRIMTHSDFRNALDAEPEPLRMAFRELIRKLNKSFGDVYYTLRSTISAHLDEDVVADALANSTSTARASSR
jgi:hypothetical protein